MVDFFLDNERFRKVKRKDSVIVREFYISFSPKDANLITQAALKDMARYFLKRFDPLTAGIAVPHFDKEHIHIHFLFAGIQYRTGKSNDKNNKEFRKFKRDVEAYQIRNYPELVHSIVQFKSKEKGRAYQKDGEYRSKKRTGKSNKEFLKETLEQTFAQSKSFEKAIQKMKEKGINYYRKSEARHGVVFENKKYRFSTLGVEGLVRKVLEKTQNLDRETTTLPYREEKENNNRSRE